MKVIPGFGTLIYMACTDKPELGWDENGFAHFTDLSTVPNFPGQVEQPGHHPPAQVHQQTQPQIQIHPDPLVLSRSQTAVPPQTSEFLTVPGTVQFQN
jgi:hypothetical protein